jgi:hypothetical protein
VTAPAGKPIPKPKTSICTVLVTGTSPAPARAAMQSFRNHICSWLRQVVIRLRRIEDVRKVGVPGRVLFS